MNNTTRHRHVAHLPWRYGAALRLAESTFTVAVYILSTMILALPTPSVAAPGDTIGWRMEYGITATPFASPNPLAACQSMWSYAPYVAATYTTPDAGVDYLHYCHLAPVPGTPYQYGTQYYASARFGCVINGFHYYASPGSAPGTGNCAPLTCPAYQRWDAPTQQCVNRCAADEQWDATMQQCQRVCPPGTIRDPVTGECRLLCPPHTTYDPQTGTCQSCPISPLPDPVIPHADEEAWRFERANGKIFDFDNLSEPMKDHLACMEREILSLGGATQRESAYRPPGYQRHLREVWDKNIEIDDQLPSLSDIHKEACRDTIREVKGEMRTHEIVHKPVTNSRHQQKPARAFDLIVIFPGSDSLDARIDFTAFGCGLYRFNVYKDPNHFHEP